MDGLDTIYARNCELRRIDKSTGAAFLSVHHRLGDTGARYRYGLFVSRTTGAGELRLPEGTLVAVSTFSNARRWRKGGRVVSSYEWIRYASLTGVRVVGGMSRMLRAFVGDVHPDDVMTYADLSWPDGGEVYDVLGFRYEGVVEKRGFRCGKYRFVINP